MKLPGVLMVTGAYWPELSGGGLQCRTMIQALRDRFRFRVLTTCTDRRLPSADLVDGVPVTRVYVDVARAHTKVIAAIATVWFFLRHHREFDLVHLHGFSQKSVLLVLLARVWRKRVMITIHTAGQDEPDAIKRLGRMAFWSYASADCFVAISEAMAGNYRRSGLPASRLRVVPNGIDTNRFAPPSDDERRAAKASFAQLPQAVPWVLFVGFFSADKAPDVLFESWRAIQPSAPASALLFVGATASRYHEVDASLADSIRAGAAAAGLADRVLCAGEVPDVERAYRAADIFVMPSTREAFGMALLEGMSSGLPCIASRLDGVTDEIVGEDAGVLTPPRDVPALASALSGLLQGPGRRAELGVRARARVVERYGLEASAIRWADLYAQVLK